MPQFTQITGTPASRSAGSSRCSGSIGSAIGPVVGAEMIDPSARRQKSFCMSITMTAVRSRSTVTFCGAQAIVTGTGAGAGTAMSTSLFGRPPRELTAEAELRRRALLLLLDCFHSASSLRHRNIMRSRA